MRLFVLAAAVTLAAAGAAHAQVTGNPTRGQQLWANPGAGLPACETCHSTATPPVVTGFPSLATMRNSLGAPGRWRTRSRSRRPRRACGRAATRRRAGP